MPQQNLAYPVIVTFNGAEYIYQCPDFPEIQISAPSMEIGVPTVTAALHDAVTAMQFPPAPTNPSNLPMLPGQFMLQVVL